jgi:hypothetical protein
MTHYPYRKERAMHYADTKKEKLEVLAESWGMTVDALLARGVADSVTPGICMNSECSYTTEYEPDQDQGWCEECETNTVMSALKLAGIC